MEKLEQDLVEKCPTEGCHRLPLVISTHGDNPLCIVCALGYSDSYEISLNNSPEVKKEFQENAFKHKEQFLKILSDLYRLFNAEIARGFEASEDDHTSTENLSVEVEFLIEHLSSQLYKNEFEDSQETNWKFIRSCLREISYIISLAAGELPDTYKSSKISSEIVENLKATKISYVSKVNSVSKLYQDCLPQKLFVSEISEEVADLDLCEREKEEITYDQICELYASSNEAPLDPPEFNRVTMEMEVDFSMRVRSQLNVLRNLKNFTLPKLKGIIVTAIGEKDEELIEFISDCITQKMGHFHFRASEFPSFQNYMKIIPMVTRRVRIDWFTIYVNDFNQIFTESSQCREVIIERCKIIQLGGEKLDFSVESVPRLEEINLYDTQFPRDVFGMLIIALKESQLGLSLKLLQLYMIGVPKVLVNSLTEECQFETKFYTDDSTHYIQFC
ncbi:unnamed protein product [Moneuplotes crassus]|uniref:Uncharacterized protein n=1 Tax=Euplotes crassus TaxID=5936 RepID=A0AAD1XEB0_EUPCR|nr:unnamed protein product [Moneuplotes crassus]